MKYPILHGASLSPTLGKNKGFSLNLMNSRYPIQFQNTIPLGWEGALQSSQVLLSANNIRLLQCDATLLSFRYTSFL